MKDSILFSIVILFLLAGSLFFVIAGNPERQTAVSLDGAFVMRAQTRGLSFSITEDRTDGHAARLSPVYRIDPNTVLDHHATVQYISDLDLSGRALARLDEELDTWLWLPTEYDNGRFITETLQTGSFALFGLEDVDTTSFGTLLTEAIKQKPKTAIRANFSYATRADDEGSFLEVEGIGAEANCGGEQRFMETGPPEIMTLDTEDATGRLITQWTLSEEGCPSEMPFALVR